MQQNRDIKSSIDQLSSRVSDLLSQVKDLLGVMMSGGQVTGGQTQPQSRASSPVPTLSLPVSPKTINEMILSTDLSGHLFIDIGNITFTCPAGKVTTAYYPVFPNTVIMFGSPIKCFASYYSSAITVSVTVDGKPVIGIGGTPFPITGANTLELGQYFYARQGVAMTVTNNSAIDTTISLLGEAIVIKREYFDTFFVPLMSFGYDLLKDLAFVVNGGREVT